MVTTAEAEIDGFDSSVAVTVTVGGAGALAGAVYRPDEVMKPQKIPAQPGPDTLQFTTLLPDGTVAVNCTCPPGFTLVALGETLSANPFTMVTLAALDRLGSATACAETVTFDDGTVAGAV
jgi:hypothetical protein